MDIVQRLILAVLLLLLAPMVHADTVPAKKYYEMQGGGSNVHRTSSAESTCQSYLANSSAWTYSSTVQDKQYPQQPTFKCMGTSKTVPNSAPAHIHTAQELYTCDGIGGILRFKDGLPSPALYPMVCIDVPPCPEGQTRQSDGTCGAPPVQCIDGRILEHGPFADSDGDGALPPVACIRGCRALLTGGGGAPEMDCSIGGAGTIGVCSYVLPGNYMDVGETCSPDNKPVKTPPADRGPCPSCDCMKSGGSWGQVNGVDACMPRGAAGTLPVKTTPAPTIKTEKPKPTPENPNPEEAKTVTPSPTVTVIPNPNGGEPTVKEETTNPDGSTTTTTTGMGEYCKNNATSSTCKSNGTGNGGSGGGDFKGSCEMGYICTGDGVQCAIARKIHQNRCDDLAELKKFEPAAEEGRRILMGEDDEEVKNWLNKEGDSKRTINLANEIKESGDYQFAAQCWSDLTVNIMGAAFTLPLSKLCSLFEMLGYVLLAASYLWALRIVGIW